MKPEKLQVGQLGIAVDVELNSKRVSHSVHSRFVEDDGLCVDGIARAPARATAGWALCCSASKNEQASELRLALVARSFWTDAADSPVVGGESRDELHSGANTLKMCCDSRVEEYVGGGVW